MSDPQEKKDEFVSKDAYTQVSEDMHRFKSAAREAAAKAAELEQKLANKEREEMEAKQQFEDLYKKEQSKAKQLEERLDKNNKLFKDSIKKSHLKSELGPGVKDQYLDFADINSIEIDEAGKIVADSLKAVADKFREEHPSLVGDKDAPNPNSVGSSGSPTKQLDINKIMNDKEAFRELLKGMLTER
jgi:predicted nuclease with TOPRIM domain